MENVSDSTSGGWLAFELSVIKRLKFASILFPFTYKPDLGNYLKHWGVKVLANDPLSSVYMESLARIGNNGVTLSENDVALVLEDAYVPQYRLNNPALRNWFGETDSWWFDNVRANIERLSSPISRAVALSLGLKVGSYVFSFDEETRELRRPLSKVYERLWSLLDEPVNNGIDNQCSNVMANNFTAENYPDLFFLKLPPVLRKSMKESLGKSAWREEWVHGNDGFWDDLERSFGGRLGSPVQSKTQYLELIQNLLETAGHIPLWAIEHVEDGFISTQDIVAVLNKVRRAVDTIFTKDFSEFTGTRAVIITA